MQKIAFLLFTVLILPSLSSAEFRLTEEHINLKDCEPIGHVDYVKSICGSLRNNDLIMHQGSPERSNLIVTRARRNNDPYFMALGIDNANYSIADSPIQVLYRKNLLGQKVAHAIVYRLDYKRYDGQKGYQIITVRIGRRPYRLTRTCTVMAYDSNTSSQFSNIKASKREASMRGQALEYIRRNDFHSKSQSCMRYEHNHEEKSEPQAD